MRLKRPSPVSGEKVKKSPFKVRRSVSLRFQAKGQFRVSRKVKFPLNITEKRRFGMKRSASTKQSSPLLDSAQGLFLTENRYLGLRMTDRAISDLENERFKSGLARAFSSLHTESTTHSLPANHSGCSAWSVANGPSRAKRGIEV